MKKIYISLIFVFLFISLVSATATVSLEKTPNNLYNLGDKINLIVKIIPNGKINNLFSLTLDCKNKETEVYKEYLALNNETTKNILIPLVKNFIGDSLGNCEIESHLGNHTEILSNQFRISNLINIDFNAQKIEFSPGKIINLTGTAKREDGREVEGTVEVMLPYENKEISSNAAIINGTFLIRLQLPKNMPSGRQSLTIKAYEINQEGQLTNNGEIYPRILIKQIPTNIEIILDNKQIKPGTSLQAKILLHDQTGKEISSYAYIAIKNPEGIIVQKIEKLTGENFEYPIKYNEAPGNWTISTYSENIIDRKQFEIETNKEISTNIINNTLIVKNVGNVYYNKSISIKIGNQTLKVPIYLNVDQTAKYLLTAPPGEYKIELRNSSTVTTLTGNIIDAKKISDSKNNLPSAIAWSFLILVLAMITIIIFRKGFKRSFFGKAGLRKNKAITKEATKPKKNIKKELINPSIKTSLSLSISGSKQNACVGCINIKNYEEIKSGKGNTQETLQNIVNKIESEKGLIFHNKANVFFILAPIRTKTFQNEMVGIRISEMAKKLLDEHNKKFKQIIEYGISLNYGTIITKQESNEWKFMSMGTLITTAKKLAIASNQKIYVSNEVKTRIGKEIKTEIKEIGSITAHILKGVLNRSSNSKFIDGFVARQERESLKKEKEEQNDKD